jgi:alanine racemase
LKIWPLATGLEAISPSPMPNRPVWAEISRSCLLGNYQKLQSHAGSQAGLMPIVKANAYGHDALACAASLAEAGAPWLGVTSTAEGIAVRSVCPQPRILLMSGIFQGEAEAAIKHGLTAVVWEPWHLDLLEQAAAAQDMPPASLAVHLEIDTGMSRQGVQVDQLAKLLDCFHASSRLRLEGLMTHFASPEVISTIRPNPQLAKLEKALQLILDHGSRPEWLHAGNSSTVIAGPDRSALEAIASRAGVRLMFRPGLALYGYVDRITQDGLSWPLEPGLSPVLSWKTQVTSLRTLHPGDSVGYGATFTALRETWVALLPVGYADGLNRLLSNRAWVLIRGHEAPIVGRVSMDQTVVDVSAIPEVAVGDETVLLGSQGSLSITAWDLADLAGTIPWEVLCAIASRVPRVLVP